MLNFNPYLLFIFLLTISFFACNEEEIDIQKNSLTDSIDPEGISAKLEFLNATSIYLSGGLPLSTPKEESPVLESNGIDSLFVTADSTFLISIIETTGADVKGIFLKVENSFGYFNLTLKDSDLGEKPYENNTYKLMTRLLESVEPGVYCLSYAVYDVSDRISNIINLCIVIQSNKEPGEGDDNTGNDLSLTSSTWQLVTSYTQTVYEGDTTETTEIIGETDSGTYIYTIYCPDNTYEQIEVTESYRTNYMYYTFNTDSSLIVEISAYEKEVDEVNSTCETGVIYNEETDAGIMFGTWTFSEATKELTALVNYVINDEETMVRQDYKVEFENNRLILRTHVDTGFGVVHIQAYTFEPKK